MSSNPLLKDKQKILVSIIGLVLSIAVFYGINYAYASEQDYIIKKGVCDLPNDIIAISWLADMYQVFGPIEEMSPDIHKTFSCVINELKNDGVITITDPDKFYSQIN